MTIITFMPASLHLSTEISTVGRRESLSKLLQLNEIVCIVDLLKPVLGKCNFFVILNQKRGAAVNDSFRGAFK